MWEMCLVRCVFIKPPPTQDQPPTLIKKIIQLYLPQRLRLSLKNTNKTIHKSIG